MYLNFLYDCQGFNNDQKLLQRPKVAEIRELFS